jgi:hypothetical protein
VPLRQREEVQEMLWENNLVMSQSPVQSRCVLPDAQNRLRGHPSLWKRHLVQWNRINCHNGRDWSYPKQGQRRSGAFAGRRPLVQELLLNLQNSGSQTTEPSPSQALVLRHDRAIFFKT